jgi:uroporphyrin-III C-methyltransferase/precorrin-2 dehydrogenase/sirohydrochlorin ferrochelatase
VFEDASRAGIWVNVADDPELCSFHLPARVIRGAFQLAIGSAGEAPFVVRRLRQLFERRFGPEWHEWMKAAARFRNAVRDARLSRVEQEERYDRFFGATVDARHFAARVPSAEEETEWLGSAVEHHAPASSPDGAIEEKSAVGFVSLVGAGPGDPGLVTLRGRARLLRCDAIVYDRLAAPALPCDLPGQIELRGVGKEPGKHPVPQEEINALLVRLAKQGKRVVRFKGGDPYIFGRGGEEARALATAGIPFEVIPCVTAGVAISAYAGIPATHRGDAVRLTLVTAHESKKQKGPQVRWDLMAQDPHATLIGYMGVNSLPNVVDELLAAAMDPTTPAAMIERGTTSRQRVIRSNLAELPKAVIDAGIEPPALFIIGKTVRHAESLDWFSKRPLFGERIGTFASDGTLAEALELAGAEVLEVKLPITPVARVAIDALPLTGWILTNRAEVEALEEERDTPSFNPEMVAYCAGGEVATHARELGWRQVVNIPDSLTPERIIKSMREQRARGIS